MAPVIWKVQERLCHFLNHNYSVRIVLESDCWGAGVRWSNSAEADDIVPSGIHVITIHAISCARVEPPLVIPSRNILSFEHPAAE